MCIRDRPSSGGPCRPRSPQSVPQPHHQLRARVAPLIGVSVGPTGCPCARPSAECRGGGRPSTSRSMAVLGSPHFAAAVPLPFGRGTWCVWPRFE
eukprot:15464194-Alexandrium_andersonii.AAC.1